MVHGVVESLNEIEKLVANTCHIEPILAICFCFVLFKTLLVVFRFKKSLDERQIGRYESKEKAEKKKKEDNVMGKKRAIKT